MFEFSNLCVIGLGYIGLPTASTFANSGVKVLGVDINKEIINTLLSGGIHIHEPGLFDAVKKAVKSGNLDVSLKPESSDAFIISVPTPFYGGKKADLSAVKAAAESIVPVLRSGNLVILESTSPPRTTVDIVAPILEKSRLKAGVDFYLAYSPERVLPGQILSELIENDRVIGGITTESAEAGKALYGNFVKGNIFTTDATTAEMVKLMENTYRDVNIAIANEFSRLADRFGVDVREAISLANRHPRVKILNPGPGVGGHCISVDPWFFVEAAPDLAQLIQTARQVNDRQPEFVMEVIRRKMGSIAGKKVAVLGLAYKPNVDDLRESPAIEIVKMLRDDGAVVTACEPYKSDEIIEGVKVTASCEEAVTGADLILLLVAHDNFKTIAPHMLASLVKARIVIDTVGLWDRHSWEKEGFAISHLGNNHH